MNYSDKAHLYSLFRDGINIDDWESFAIQYDFPKAYRDYPEITLTADALTVLANQQIEGFTNVTEMPNSTGIVDTGYSPTGFDYNIINTTAEGSFFSIGGFTP
jgi:hypothetical protein